MSQVLYVKDVRLDLIAKRTQRETEVHVVVGTICNSDRHFKKSFTVLIGIYIESFGGGHNQRERQTKNIYVVPALKL